MAEIFLKRLIYQPLHLHTAQFQVFMPACKRWGTIRGGVWVSAEVSGGAPLEVSGGAPKGAVVLQFPRRSCSTDSRRSSRSVADSRRSVGGSVVPPCVPLLGCQDQHTAKMGKTGQLPHSTLLVSTRPNQFPHFETLTRPNKDIDALGFLE